MDSAHLGREDDGTAGPRGCWGHSRLWAWLAGLAHVPRLMSHEVTGAGGWALPSHTDIPPIFSPAKSVRRLCGTEQVPGAIRRKLFCHYVHANYSSFPSQSYGHLGMVDLVNKNRGGPSEIECQVCNKFFLSLHMAHTICGLCVYQDCWLLLWNLALTGCPVFDLTALEYLLRSI